MKTLKLTGFEVYLIQESLKHYKSLLEDSEFPPNSIVTKHYVESMISEIEEKLSERPFQNMRRTHAPS